MVNKWEGREILLKLMNKHPDLCQTLYVEYFHKMVQYLAGHEVKKMPHPEFLVSTLVKICDPTAYSILDVTTFS